MNNNLKTESSNGDIINLHCASKPQAKIFTKNIFMYFMQVLLYKLYDNHNPERETHNVSAIV